jgi:hypothetical protein
MAKKRKRKKLTKSPLRKAKKAFSEIFGVVKEDAKKLESFVEKKLKRKKR